MIILHAIVSHMLEVLIGTNVIGISIGGGFPDVLSIIQKKKISIYINNFFKNKIKTCPEEK